MESSARKQRAASSTDSTKYILIHIKDLIRHSLPPVATPRPPIPIYGTDFQQHCAVYSFSPGDELSDVPVVIQLLGNKYFTFVFPALWRSARLGVADKSGRADGTFRNGDKGTDDMSRRMRRDIAPAVSNPLCARRAKNHSILASQGSAFHSFFVRSCLPLRAMSARKLRPARSGIATRHWAKIPPELPCAPEPQTQCARARARGALSKPPISYPVKRVDG